MDNLARSEKEKYEEIWKLPNYGFYSDETAVLPDIIDWMNTKPIRKILIVGCGEGHGIHKLSKEGYDVYGLDIVDVLKYPEYKNKLTVTPVWKMKFKDLEFDTVIAVDILEHIPKEKIDDTLKEIKRVSKFFYFVISCKPDNFGKTITKTLHLSVHSPSWWLEKVEEYFEIDKFGGSQGRVKIFGQREVTLSKNILEKKQVLYISFYTKNTPYEKEIENLKTSLRKFNLPYETVAINDLGNWDKNTRYKATFIRKMLDKFPDKNLVFLDADSVVRQYPKLFDEIECDLAIAYIDWKLYNPNRGFKELNTSTMYFANNEINRKLLDIWIEKNKTTPVEIWEQKVLQNILESEWKEKLNIYYLPIEYCKIFDLSKGGNVKPVIELFQASRRYKQR